MGSEQYLHSRVCGGGLAVGRWVAVVIVCTFGWVGG